MRFYNITIAVSLLIASATTFAQQDNGEEVTSSVVEGATDNTDNGKIQQLQGGMASAPDNYGSSHLTNDLGHNNIPLNGPERLIPFSISNWLRGFQTSHPLTESAVEPMINEQQKEMPVEQQEVSVPAINPLVPQSHQTDEQVKEAVQPAQPPQPEQAVQPEQAIQPVQPVQPPQPEQPVQPPQPEQPEQPEQAIQPAQPAQPVQPPQPAQAPVIEEHQQETALATNEQQPQVENQPATEPQQPQQQADNISPNVNNRQIEVTSTSTLPGTSTSHGPTSTLAQPTNTSAISTTRASTTSRSASTSTHTTTETPLSHPNVANTPLFSNNFICITIMFLVATFIF